MGYLKEMCSIFLNTSELRELSGSICTELFVRPFFDHVSTEEAKPTTDVCIVKYKITQGSSVLSHRITQNSSPWWQEGTVHPYRSMLTKSDSYAQINQRN